MKPLFIFETKPVINSMAVLENRIIEDVLPMLKKINYKYAFHSVEELHEGMLLQVFKKENAASILIVPWVRPYNITKTQSKSLADYPRLAIPKQLKHDSNEDKIKKLNELCSKYQLYFLVVVQRANGDDMYWLEKYETIPLQFWKLTYRKDKDNLDRVHFTQYDKFNFLKLKELQKKLNSIFKI